MPRSAKFLLFLVSVVLASACASNKASSTPSTTDKYAVYKAVIESLYLSEGFPLVVLKDHTALDTSPGESLDNVIAYIQENLGSAIESETLNDFRAKNRQSQEELDAGLFDKRCVLISEVKIKGIFEHGGNWSQFYITYPNSQGIMTLSRVGFNTKKNQALLYVGNQSDYLAGRGYYIFLTKKGEDWIIQTMIKAWIS